MHLKGIVEGLNEKKIYKTLSIQGVTPRTLCKLGAIVTVTGCKLGPVGTGARDLSIVFLPSQKSSSKGGQR